MRSSTANDQQSRIVLLFAPLGHDCQDVRCQLTERRGGIGYDAIAQTLRIMRCTTTKMRYKSEWRSVETRILALPAL